MRREAGGNWQHLEALWVALGLAIQEEVHKNRFDRALAPPIELVEAPQSIRNVQPVAVTPRGTVSAAVRECLHGGRLFPRSPLAGSKGRYATRGETVVFKESAWEYNTSYEDSESIALITGAAGKLFFINTETDEHLDFKYSILSIGLSKGGVFNLAKSAVTSSSGGFTKVQVRSPHLFNRHKFPCNGVVIASGVTAGIFAPSFIDDAGAQAAFLGFGANLFAWVPVWGLFSAAVPSAGVSVGILSCETAISYKTVPDVTNPNVG